MVINFAKQLKVKQAYEVNERTAVSKNFLEHNENDMKQEKDEITDSEFS